MSATIRQTSNRRVRNRLDTLFAKCWTGLRRAPCQNRLGWSRDAKGEEESWRGYDVDEDESDECERLRPLLSSSCIWA